MFQLKCEMPYALGFLSGYQDKFKKNSISLFDPGEGVTAYELQTIGYLYRHGILKPSEAMQIDEKFDNGNMENGKIIAIWSSTADSYPCPSSKTDGGIWNLKKECTLILDASL